MTNQPEKTPQENEQPLILAQLKTLTQENLEIFEGPLPNPKMLEGYKNIDPSFPERMMRIAESHSAADIENEGRVSRTESVVPIIGQVFTFLLGIGSILACIYLAKAGYTGPAIAAIVGGFSPIIIGAFKSLQRKD